MIIALTGTPGTGKTTTSQKLKEKGYNIIEINKFIQEQNISTEYIDDKDTNEVDLEILDQKLEAYLDSDSSTDHTLIDGHLSHNLSFIDRVIILRCHPKKLEERLKKVGFQENKIRENVEAEAVDVISIESVELHGIDKVFEINVTETEPDEVAAKVIQIIGAENSAKIEYKVGNIDWSEVILEWY